MSPTTLLPDHIISELSTAFYHLCSTDFAKYVTLRPYKIKNSNAADQHRGVEFSKAYCDLENYEKGFLLGDIFRRGLDIGIDYLAGKSPESKHEKIVLDRLIQYLNNDAGEFFSIYLG